MLFEMQEHGKINYLERNDLHMYNLEFEYVTENQ